jgi:tuftelin-interacting protein 11
MMSSSPEVEKFEITDNDFADAFNPERKKFRLSKNQTIYGIWADEEDDSRRPSKSSKDRKSYTTPVAFVSGGIKIGDKVTKETNEDDINITDSDASDDEPAPAPAPRRGYKSTTGQGRSAFQPQKQKDLERDMVKTYGIGHKLLEKMGHVTGKGLGKNLQGISTPVEAVLRKGRGAIGLYGSEKSERAERDFPTKPDSEEEEEKEFAQKLQQWKKGAESEKKKKPKYIYKTAEELIASGPTKRRQPEVQSDLAKVKVIDMTGKEQRVLSGYHALSLKHDKPIEDDTIHSQERRHFDLPELLHNLDLLVDMSESEVIQNDRKLKYERDLIVNLEYEQTKLATVCEQESKQIGRLKEVLDIVQKCEEMSNSASVAGSATDRLELLEQCATLFSRLQDDYYEEYRLYELSNLAVAVVYPLMKKEFEGWEPLKRPRHGLSAMERWKIVLEGISQPYQLGQAPNELLQQPYDRLVWEVVIPYIRTTLRIWNVRLCDPMVAVLEAWRDLLPRWMLTHVLEQLVFPKLQAAVEVWNPLTDTVPIHAWIHPWLPLMAEGLEPLYAPIRHKLANALTNWHPSDPSAKLILQPWCPVFRAGHMDAFVVKNIYPKLAICLQEFIINPNQQLLEPWNWVMSWIDMMPMVSMVTLLEKHFFPRWLHVLNTWLSGPNPNYYEVTSWYQGWKELFPPKLLANSAVKDQLNKALDMMNCAVTGAHSQPGARENVAYLASTERRRDFETNLPAAAAASAQETGAPAVRSLTASSSVPASFKELMERRAEEHNIVFLPVTNKFHEAKQVYRFGRVQIYVDRGVIFAFTGGLWSPISLNDLVDKAR